MFPVGINGLIWKISHGIDDIFCIIIVITLLRINNCINIIREDLFTTLLVIQFDWLYQVKENY